MQDSVTGVLHDYNPETKLVGAVNRENVTCYLDSLLFSMFAQTDSFEGILAADEEKYDKYPEKKELVILLRLWVNMLRTGKLITTDIVRNITVHADHVLTRLNRQKSYRSRSEDVAGQRPPCCVNKTSLRPLPSSLMPSTTPFSL